MTNFSELPAKPSGTVVSPVAALRLAVAAYLARFRGSSRDHTGSDLSCYLFWCAGRDLDPLAARRPHLELYIRWMQEVRRFRPSTVSRRFLSPLGHLDADATLRYGASLIDFTPKITQVGQVASVSVYVWRPFQDAGSSVYQFTGDNVLDPLQLDNSYRWSQLAE